MHEIILGPPGTGKTETLLGIIDDSLAKGIAPEEIGLVSFTRRAANEAIERASEKFGLDKKRFLNIRTMHSMCFRQLGLTPGDVLQGKKLKEFADWIGIEITTDRSLDEEGSLTGFTQGDRILHMENHARVRCQPLELLYDWDSDDLDWRDVSKVSRGLAEWKKKNHLVDFTDMLSLFAASHARPQLRVLLGDEQQDSSLLQWRCFDKLSQGCERTVSAGDDDQCVFHWAGAALRHFVQMPGEIRVLGQSWRVPTSIQSLALQSIERVMNRRLKRWSPRPEAGIVEDTGYFDQVDLGGEDILILARNTYILQEHVVPILRNEGIIYEYRGETSVDPQILEAITSWEHLRDGGEVSESGYVNIKKWRRGPIPSRGEQIPIWHEGLDRLPRTELSYILAARHNGESLIKRPRVRLSTIHSAKGAQAQHVVLFSDMAPRTAREYKKSPENEFRVWYVGLTRSKEKLTLVKQIGWNGYSF